jgi:hypothetical protein
MKIEEIAVRPRTYLGETGVPWLMGGLVFSLLGGSALIRQALPLEYKMIPMMVGIGCATLVSLGALALNRRVVFPRGGYVEPRDPELGLRELIYMALPLAGIGLLFVILKAFTTRSWAELSGTVFAIGFAAVIAAFGWKMKRPSAYWFAGYTLCLGAFLFQLRVPYMSMSALQLGLGAPLAMIGAARLRRFLKANPRVEDRE